MSGKCPRCSSELVDREFGSVTLDGCTSCGGIWFDADELTKLARDPMTGMMDVERAFQPAIGGIETLGTMGCPKCGIPLYGFSFPHTPDIHLDACRNCKGIWVDDGELQLIAQRANAARTQPIAQSPQGLNRSDTMRLNVRGAASFLITCPCPNCRENNPAAAVICWACGQSLHQAGMVALCPRCDRDMVEVSPEHSPTRLDACLNCKGVWFGGGELTAFLQFGLEEIQGIRQRIGDGLGHFVDREVNESTLLSCPDCHFCMERDMLGNRSQVMADICPTCRGVWLDAGELVTAYEAFQTGDLRISRSQSDPWR